MGRQGFGGGHSAMQCGGRQKAKAQGSVTLLSAPPPSFITLLIKKTKVAGDEAPALSRCFTCTVSNSDNCLQAGLIIPILRMKKQAQRHGTTCLRHEARV